MRKFFLMLFVVLSTTLMAQTPQSVLDKAVATIKNGGVVTANYSVSTNSGSQSGSIAMHGSKFRVLSNDIKTWYNGKDQWTYSSATGEVNITTPTAQELAMTNPYAAAQTFKTNYNMWKAYIQEAGSYTIKLMPKRKSNIKQILIYVANGTNQIKKAVFEMTGNNRYVITISNYKTKVKMADSAFAFDKSLVPAGTEVVDLR